MQKIPDNTGGQPLAIRGMQTTTQYGYDYWLRMELERRYWVNQFDIDGLNNTLSSWLLNTLFWYGEAFLVKLDGKYFVAKASNIKFDLEGNFKEAIGHLAPKMWKHIKDSLNGTPIKLTKQNAVYCRWNDYGIPMPALLWEFIRGECEMEQAVFTNAFSSLKIGYKSTPLSSNNLNAEKLNDNILSSTSIFANIVNAGNDPTRPQGATGILEGRNSTFKELPTKNISLDYFNVLKEYVKLNYMRFGRRIGHNDKKERVIVSEQETNNANYNVLEREHSRNLLDFTIRANETFGLNLALFSYIAGDEKELEADTNGEEIT